MCSSAETHPCLQRSPSYKEDHTMPQQSTTQRREDKSVTGSKTREQQKAVIEKREKTKGADVSPHEKSLAEARRDQELPAGEYDLSSGDRSIKRGAHQETEHHKRRQH
jgi:hypothetical protein